jgi:hypothetical protein
LREAREFGFDGKRRWRDDHAHHATNEIAATPSTAPRTRRMPR